MKLIKFFILTLTIFSITLVSACGSNPLASTDYTGKWYAIDSKGGISKLIIQKQGESYLLTHKDYWFDSQFDLDQHTFNHTISFNTNKRTYLENKVINIKDNILELDEGRAGNGTLIYKDGKFTGKPNPSYSESLTFEKDTQNNPKAVYDKAKKQLEKYMSTKKVPQDPKLFNYYDNEKIVDDFLNQ